MNSVERSTCKTYRAWIEQHGLTVAEVSSPDMDTCEQEIRHYALQYVQDGELAIKRNYQLATNEGDE